MQSRDTQWRRELREALPAKERMTLTRVQMRELDPADRLKNPRAEVNMGLTEEQARAEATRCLDCPDPQCVKGCPVGIDIPGFVKNIQRGNDAEAAKILFATSALPAVCGRVCPQEKQCESRCIYTKSKRQAVAIGYLERFAADRAREVAEPVKRAAPETDTPRVAVIGSGPAGLSFAGEMANRGFNVTVFEALHEIGGVLKYGIPEFRLPNAVVDAEIEGLKKRGVKFHKDIIVGKTITVDSLFDEGFAGVFIGSGAGLPRFMNIPGENFPGVMSCNEYLTRINLMGAGQEGCDTPVLKGRRVAVIGGGNTAMDAVRTARRQGAEQAMIVYRRSEEEMPARAEEIHHARQEGVKFMTLHNPVEYLADEKGRVSVMRLQKMELGEPDESGRRSPVPIPGAIEDVEVDLVIVSVGVSPNPLIPATTGGLDVSRKGTIVVDEDTMRTTRPETYAGGDIVRGGATVILAMGDGRRAARAMAAQLEHSTMAAERSAVEP